MSRKMKKPGDPCPFCTEPLKAEFLERRSKIRGLKISRALTQNKLLGEPVGRPRMYDYDAIRKLRKEGLSYREICQKLNVSFGSVQRAVMGY